MFRALYFGDRQPPLYDLVLWLTIRVFGHGEFAVRLPTLIAGTLVIPVLYELGRELYDRRTGLVAAGFAAISPLLVWYSQEVRMYTFVALFGLLALLTQLRVIRNGTMVNWAAYILATAALLWSHYFGVLLIGVQQLIFVGVLVHRRRQHQPIGRLALGFAYSGAVLAMQLVPFIVFARHQYRGHLRRGRLAERDLRLPVLLLGAREHGVVALGLSARCDDRAVSRDVAVVPAPLAGAAGPWRIATDDDPRRGRDRPSRPVDRRVCVRPLAVRGAQLPDPRASGAAGDRAAGHGLDPQSAGRGCSWQVASL